MGITADIRLLLDRGAPPAQPIDHALRELEDEPGQRLRSLSIEHLEKPVQEAIRARTDRKDEE